MQKFITGLCFVVLTSYLIIGIIIIVLCFTFSFFRNCSIDDLLYTRTSFRKIASVANEGKDELFLGQVSSNIEGRQDIYYYFKRNNTIVFYDNYAKRSIIQEIDLPGEYIDHKFRFDSSKYHKIEYMYVTVKNTVRTKLLAYSFNTEFKLSSSFDTDCVKFIRWFSNYNSTGNEQYALQSEDGCKIVLFEPMFKVIYEYKHPKPFVYAEYEPNFAFDGVNIFNIYTPEKIEKTMDYKDIDFKTDKLDLKKPLIGMYSYFYNNGYLINFDEKSFKASSYRKIGNAYDIFKKQSSKGFDLCYSYFYACQEGIYDVDNDVTKSMLKIKNMKNDNVYVFVENSYHYYSITDRETTKMIHFNRNYKSKGYNAYMVEELDAIPGEFRGAFVKGDLIVYTTEGIFKSLNPTFHNRESPNYH